MRRPGSHWRGDVGGATPEWDLSHDTEGGNPVDQDEASVGVAVVLQYSAEISCMDAVWWLGGGRSLSEPGSTDESSSVFRA